jgi:hypothetical protein
VAKHLSAAGPRQHTEGVRVGERRRHFRARTAERRDEVLDPELGSEQGRGGLQHVANRPGQEVKPATDRLGDNAGHRGGVRGAAGHHECPSDDYLAFSCFAAQ